MHLMNQHAKFWSCEQCGQVQANRMFYIRHMKKFHGVQGEKSHLLFEERCRFCDARGKCKVCVKPTKVKIVKGFDPTVVLKARIEIIFKKVT